MLPHSGFCCPLWRDAQQVLGGPRGLAGGRTGLPGLLGGVGAGTWHRAAVPFVPVAQLNNPLCEARPHRPAFLGPAREAGPRSLEAGTPGVLAPAPAAVRLSGSAFQSLPLISASRWLLKRGELFVVEETGLFRKLASRPTCYLFLFNDVLVVTKKKR